MTAENETPQGTIVEDRGRRGSGNAGDRLEGVTVNLTPRSTRSLNDLVGWTGCGKTDTINRSLQIYAFMQEILENGGALYVRPAGHGALERVRFF